jgi:hypothetical protein
MLYVKVLVRRRRRRAIARVQGSAGRNREQITWSYGGPCARLCRTAGADIQRMVADRLGVKQARMRVLPFYNPLPVGYPGPSNGGAV